MAERGFKKTGAGEGESLGTLPSAPDSDDKKKDGDDE